VGVFRPEVGASTWVVEGRALFHSWLWFAGCVDHLDYRIHLGFSLTWQITKMRPTHTSPTSAIRLRKVRFFWVLIS